MNDFISGLIFFAAGLLVAFLNYLLSLLMYKKMKANTAIAIPFIRQVINVGSFVLVYFIVSGLSAPLTASLVGAALGLTLPNIIFAYRLSQIIARDDIPDNKEDNGVSEADNNDNDDG